MSYVEHSPRRPKDEVGTVAWAFRALDLPFTATEAECRRSYRKNVLKNHPDRLVGEPVDVVERAEARMRDANHAWDVLQDHFKAPHQEAKDNPWNPFERSASGSIQWASFESDYAGRPSLHLESIGIVVGSLIVLSLAGLISLGLLYVNDLQEARAPSQVIGWRDPLRGPFGRRTITQFGSALTTETSRHGTTLGP